MRQSSCLLGAAIGAVLTTASPLPMVASVAQAADAEPMGLEEIVVFARKREERLQDVPVAVSAISAADLEKAGVTNVEDLSGKVPSLYFSQNNNVSPQKDNKAIVLRGVGFNPVLEPSTGFFIDGVYQPGIGYDLGFLDVARVEVLRGPQGTLFGRNTEAGAVNIVTRRPGDETRGRASMEVDDLFSARAQASIDGPIVPGSWSGGIAVQAGHSRGYYDNITTGDPQDDMDNGAVRASLRYLSGDTVDAYLTVDGSSSRGHALGVGVEDSRGEDYVVEDDTVGDNEQDSYGGALNVDVKLDAVNVTSLTGYRKSTSSLLADVDGGAVNRGNFQAIDIEESVLSQELRLASADVASPLQWLVGAYLFDQKYDQITTARFADMTGTPLEILNGTISDASAHHKRKGYALFGQATWRGLDGKLDVTAGLRWSKEKVRATRSNFLDVPFFGLVGLPNPTVISDDRARDTFDNVSPVGSIAYRWTPEVMTYATVAKGFKAGGFERFASTQSILRRIGNETTVNYEVGVKAEGWDRRVTLNVALYRVDIKNMQLFTLITDPDTGLPRPAISNAGDSRSQGVEAELTVLPVDGLTLQASLAVTDTKFKSFVDVDGIDRAGDAFPYVPKTSASVSAEYVHPIGGDFDVRLSGSYRYIGKHHAGIGTAQDPRFDLDSYGIADFEVGVTNKAWEAALFLRNAFDEYAIVNKFPGVLGNSFRTVLPPRTFGIRLAYNW